MNFKQWCEIDEHIYIAETDERYKQYGGFRYSEKLIERLAEMKILCAQIFINSFLNPREMFLSAVQNIADSKTKRLELKLYNVRNKKIVSQNIGLVKTLLIGVHGDSLTVLKKTQLNERSCSMNLLQRQNT